MTIQTAIRHNALMGKPVAEEITRSVYQGVEELAAKGWPVKLVSITIGDVPAVHLYVRNQARGAEKAGIMFEERQPARHRLARRDAGPCCRRSTPIRASPASSSSARCRSTSTSASCRRPSIR